MDKVFIVILNWNRAKDTLECLKSVQKLKSGGASVEVLIVDNGSDEKIMAPVKIIRNSENLGFAGGNNTGIRYALSQGADYILVLNNDTVVHENLLVKLLKVAKDYPKAAALTPKIYFAKGFEFHKDHYQPAQRGKVIWSAGGVFDWENMYGINRGVDEVDNGQYDTVEETDYATGAAVLYKAEALKKIGLFDEKYFLYLEDADLSMRIKMAGWSVYYVPEAIVWHKVAQSSVIGGELNDYFISRNRMVFGIKYAPIRTKIALIRESIRLLANGRRWQKRGIIDYYLAKLGKGSWK